MDTHLTTDAGAAWLEALEAFAAALAGLVDQQVKLNKATIEALEAQKEVLLNK